ncbi:MAG: FAD-dependent oxidoreductase [Terriglobales bacterium]
MAATPKYRARIPDAQFWRDMVPCQAACPVHTDAGRYVQLIAAGDERSGYLTARSPNPFASICGRVCAAPCEDACRRGKVDQPVTIRALKRFVCERYGPESGAPQTAKPLFDSATEPGNKWPWHLPMLTQSRKHGGRREKVAIIGAGPAGLACAHDLAVMGYRPTVFEASAIAGGMMFHGIPEFRLSRGLIEKEIQTILDLGVELRLNTPLTAEFGLQQLRQQEFQAVFIAVGAQGGRDLPIEGSDLDGVIKAIEFLLNVNRGYRVELGRRVVVIGGGFVAFDAARAALRMGVDREKAQQDSETSMVTALDAARAALRAGVEEVRMLSLESFTEMPVLRTAQGREEFEEARREGIVFQTQRGARRFTGKDGRVCGIELIGVKQTYDFDGRFNPVYDPDISESIDADSVILAIGQKADLSFLHPQDRIELTPQGAIKIDRETLATSAPGVFAGGDVAFGPRNLIEAIANGKLAAASMDSYLRRAHAVAATQVSITKLPTRTYSTAPEYEKLTRSAPPTIPLDRRTGIAEVEMDYPEAEARRQAQRCLCCHIQTIYDARKCVLCGRCVDVCPQRSLKLVPWEQLETEGAAKPDLIRHYGLSTADGPLSVMLKDDEKCIRCGLCAIRCPTEAMTMEVLFYEDREAMAQSISAGR